MWLKKRVRKWLGLDELEHRVADIESRLQIAEWKAAQDRTRLTSRIAELDEHTRMDADVGMRGLCTVILSGVYRGRGFVSFYEMDAVEFRHHVEHLRSSERSHMVRHVDAPHSYSGGSFQL